MVEISSIEKLFEVDDTLAQKFFKTLAMRLSNRLRNMPASSNAHDAKRIPSVESPVRSLTFVPSN
jgi:hypothetical protein